MKLYNLIKLGITLLGLFILMGAAQAQYVRIHGVVSDSLSGDPIPFVNVFFKGKNIGTITDIDGKYDLESAWGSKHLIFSSLGFEPKEIKISERSNQILNVSLASTSQELAAFEVSLKKKRYRNKENPAVLLIKNVLAHKDENRGKSFEFFEFEKYIKRQYDLNNFTDKLFDSPGMKGFQVLKSYVDTSTLNGKPFLPFLIQEKMAKVYQRRYGKDVSEIVIANRLSGFDNSDLSSGVDQFMSKIGGEIDIYESKILLFDKSFTSPISSLGPTIYRYYITDSTIIDGFPYKKLAFMPRNHTMTAFTGHMWVGDSLSNYAVQAIVLNLDKRMNINFIDDLQITQEFVRDEEIGWHIVKEIMIVDMQLLGRTTGIFSTKTTTYSKFKANLERPNDFYKNLNPLSYEIDEGGSTDKYWEENRHDSLTESEIGVYDLADTIQNIRQFKTLNILLRMINSAYVGVGKIDIGPLTSLASYNVVEGMRFRVGFRANLKLSKTWRFSGWGAYGLADQKLKYRGEVEYFFNRNPYRRLSVSYVDNLFQPGFPVKNIPPDHYMLSFRRTANPNMFYVKNVKATYDYEWFNGLSNSFEVNIKDISATRLNPMVNVVTNEVEDRIIDNTLSIGTRFSINERFVQGEYMRKPIKTTAPVFKFKYTFSDPVIGSDYSYHKLFLRIEKRFMPGILGFTDIEIEGNKIIGKVPYPLLIIHRGNETMTYEKNSFNMMNFVEFASDQSVGIFVEHHFNGLLTGFIPLVRKSKMRVVVSVKVLAGNVSDENKDVSDPELIEKPIRLSSLQGKPYSEGGIGIENIFNIFRIDMVKRFTYLDAPQIGSTFGVTGLGPRIAFKLKF